MKQPLVSIIIPVYNGERYIKSAIESVLSQTYGNIEVIVVDDGSTDHTKDIVQTYQEQIVYIPKEHSGVSHTLNMGIDHSSGQYLAFLDADDLWEEKKLALQISAIQENKVDMVLGYVQQFISPELDDKDKNIIHCPDKPLAGYSRDTLLIEKEALFRVGKFSSTYQIGEFIEWYARAIDLDLHTLVLPEILAYRRLHNTNMTRQDATQRIDYARLIKVRLDRRRSRQNPE